MTDMVLEYQGDDAERFLAAFHGQLPFVTSKAINDTAKDFQKEQLAYMGTVFTLRQPAFARRSVKITEWAKKTSLQAQVAMVQPGEQFGSRGRSLFAKFEAGGVKRGSESMPVAIPSENLRISPTTNIPRSLYPKNLRLLPRKGVTGMLGPTAHRTRRGVIQLKGKRRTFVLDPRIHQGSPVWGVYQRLNREEIQLLWVFKRVIPIPASLHFVDNARKVVSGRFSTNFSAALDYALRTARR